MFRTKPSPKSTNCCADDEPSMSIASGGIKVALGSVDRSIDMGELYHARFAGRLENGDEDRKPWDNVQHADVVGVVRTISERTFAPLAVSVDLEVIWARRRGHASCSCGRLPAWRGY